MALLVCTVAVEPELDIALWVGQLPCIPGVQTVLSALPPAPFPNAGNWALDHTEKVGERPAALSAGRGKKESQAPVGEIGSVLPVLSSSHGLWSESWACVLPSESKSRLCFTLLCDLGLWQL